MTCPGSSEVEKKRNYEKNIDVDYVENNTRKLKKTANNQLLF